MEIIKLALSELMILLIQKLNNKLNKNKGETKDGKGNETTGEGTK